MTPSTTGASAGTSDTTGTSMDVAPACDPLPLPTATATFTAAQVTDLYAAVDNASPGDTLLLEPGTYTLPETLFIRTDSVFLGSTTADANDVVLDRGFGTGPGIVVESADVTIAHLTVANTTLSAIRVDPAGDAVLQGPTVYGIRAVDNMYHALQVRPGTAGAYSDGGLVACSYFGVSDEARSAFGLDCDVGGPRIHAAADWVVRDNTIEGMWCPVGAAGGGEGISLEDGVRGFDVTRNVIVDGWIGIRLGQTSSIRLRPWPNDPCDALYETHVYGGTIANNAIVRLDPELFAQFEVDAGVMVWRACGTRIVHNTILDLQDSYNGIEYRWIDESGGVAIANNLMSDVITARESSDSSSAAAATLVGNLEQVDPAVFMDAAGGDFHLTAAAADMLRVDGVGIATDFDGDPRGTTPHAGADELAQ